MSRERSSQPETPGKTTVFQELSDVLTNPDSSSMLDGILPTLNRLASFAEGLYTQYDLHISPEQKAREIVDIAMEKGLVPTTLSLLQNASTEFDPHEEFFETHMRNLLIPARLYDLGVIDIAGEDLPGTFPGSRKSIDNQGLYDLLQASPNKKKVKQDGDVFAFVHETKFPGVTTRTCLQLNGTDSNLSLKYIQLELSPAVYTEALLEK